MFWFVINSFRDVFSILNEGCFLSEFDSFLADRAQAADTLPSIAAATGQRSRKLQKDDEENPLFAL